MTGLTVMRLFGWDCAAWYRQQERRNLSRVSGELFSTDSRIGWEQVGGEMGGHKRGEEPALVTTRRGEVPRPPSPIVMVWFC